VVPVTRASGRQLHVAFDEEDAGIADLSAAFLDEAEAFLKQGFVPFAVGETGAEIEKNVLKVIRSICFNLLNSRN